MKVALITDTHWGARGDSQAFSRYFKRFYDTVFFPEIERRGIRRVYHLGDFVDRRKYINFQTLRDARTFFIEPCMERGLHLELLVGNHDSHYKNTISVNAINELLGTYPIEIHSSPSETLVGDLKVLMLPWICAENSEESYDLLEKTDARVAMGHLELAGFEMYRGVLPHSGVDPAVYRRFDLVLSGHYHHRSSRGTIHYLGSPYEFTWSDFNDPRGFHVLDTETLELDFVQNPLTIHRKFVYDDRERRLDEVVKPTNDLEDCVVRVVLAGKTNPLWFDAFMRAVESQGPQSLQVIEPSQDSLGTEDTLEPVEDTLTAFKSYISQIECEEYLRPRVDSLVTELYLEALTVASRE